MMKVNWILLHILPIMGFFLAVTLLVHQSQKRRSPASTVAWLMAILLVPYLGVPAYVVFGGRKIKSLTKNKTGLSPAAAEVRRGAAVDVGRGRRLSPARGQ